MLEIATERKTASERQGQLEMTQTPEDWFHYCLLRGRREIFTDIVEITPDIARFLLSANAENRPLNKNKAAAYAADIEAGRWDLNGESLKVSRDGFMNDGQHRCEAIILADKRIKTLVAFGLDRDSRLTLDQGLNRTVAQYLTMETGGISYSEQKTGAARMLWAHRHGLTRALEKAGATRAAVRQEYWDHQTAIDTAAEFVHQHAPSGRVLGGRPFAIAALVILRRINPSADDFMMKFLTGVDLSASDPILRLRNRLMNEIFDRHVKIEMIQLAFKHWLKGSEIRFLRTPRARSK